MQNEILNLGLRFLNIPEEAQKIEIAQGFILDNLHNTLKIAGIAAEVGMNTCYLKSGFKAQTGLTISSFIVAKRMEMARELLRTTTKKIVEIAEITGYGSLSSFSQAYKKYHGKSPVRDCRNRKNNRE